MHYTRGQIVKLAFPTEFGPFEHERMWVLVVTVNDGYYVGRLDNKPEYINSLKHGALVRFTDDQVIDVWEEHNT